ncbi:hypothetical protein ACWC2K_14280 [Streptomyces chattanoogensis]
MAFNRTEESPVVLSKPGDLPLDLDRAVDFATLASIRLDLKESDTFVNDEVVSTSLVRDVTSGDAPGTFTESAGGEERRIEVTYTVTSDT